MVDRVDLLMVSVRAPLADAVCATVCGRWSEATDLWLDVIREPSCRPLSAQCGLEAALTAGLYDLAQYFHIGISDEPPLPDFLAEPWRRSAAIRRNRARFYSRLTDTRTADQFPRAEALRLAQTLVDLHLYREAIREIFRRRLYQTNPFAAVSMLTACYSSLGEYEAVLALWRARPWCFVGGGSRSRLNRAGVCVTRAARGPVENVAEFMRSHPAGARLARLLEASDLVFASDG